MSSNTETSNLAVLIDAENINPRYSEAIFARINTLGDAGVRRIYGDFSEGRLSSWDKAIKSRGILQYPQQISAADKNPADIAIAIDAMDLMYNRQLDGFCIVSSNSDFTRLAQRLREDGLSVYGFGDRDTPEPFRNTCTRFTYLKELASNEQKPHPKKAAAMISKAIGRPGTKGGWVNLSTVGKRIREEYSDFDPTNYEGCSSITELAQKAGKFQTRKNGFISLVRRKP